MTNNLPQGWVECELKDIAKNIISGTGFPKMYQGNTVGDYPFAKVGDISKLYRNGKKNISSAENYISEDIKNKIKGKIFPKNTIVFPKIGEALKGNYRLITERKMLFDNNVMGVCFSDSIDILFLYYFLTTQDFGKFSVATTVPSIQKGNIEKIKINLPPSVEQKRIVEKIEEEFLKIDEGIEKLKLAQEQIVQYKQSVLKSAFEGNLYKTSEWKEKKFEDICTYIQRGKSPKYSNIKNDNFIINQKCVRWDKLQVEFIKYVTDDFWNNLPQERFLQAGDILWNSTGTGTIGRAYLYNGDELLKTIVDSHVTIVRTSKNDIVSKFLFYFIMSPFVQYKIEAMQSGSTNQVELGSQEIKKTILNVPTLEEQIKIVKEIEKRFEVADKTEKVITNNLEKAQQLKQSILKKAFEGRLVPQDPNDEPASVLLEKIKAERGK